MRDIPSRKKPYFKCINGIFLRYFLFTQLTLKYCLWIITAIDVFIGLLETIGMISLLAKERQTPPFIIKHLLKIFLFIPTLVFEVLVIRHYKLVHSKVLYGLKLASSVIYLFIQIAFYFLDYCPRLDSNDIK